MRSTRIGTALASPWHPAFEPHVPPRFRKSAHLLSSVFKHDSSLSKQAYKTRERLARCSSLGARRVNGLRNPWEQTIRNTDKATLPATSASREVPASRCTEAPPARMQASRPHSFTVWDPRWPHKRPLECQMRRCAYRDSYALRISSAGSKRAEQTVSCSSGFRVRNPDRLLLALMALFFDICWENFRKPKLTYYLDEREAMRQKKILLEKSS